MPENTNMPQQKFRAFIAIEISDACKKNIIDVVQSLKQKKNYQTVKWTKPQNLHITLNFLGNISQEQCQRLIYLIHNAAKDFDAFSIKLPSVTLFPSQKMPRAIVIEPQPITPVVSLALTINKLVEACDIPVEKRLFRPHLTLGKINKKPYPEKEMFNLPNMVIDVTNIKLFRSNITKERSVYTELACFDLKR